MLKQFVLAAQVLFLQLDYPILTQCSISINPENARKPLVLWRFQWVYDWNIGLKWVKWFLRLQISDSISDITTLHFYTILLPFYYMENPMAVTLLTNERKATSSVVYAPHNEMV